MKKILVPTDFSPNAASALKYAYSFAAIRNMSLDLLHVVVPQTETADYPMISGHLTTNKIDIANEVMDTWVTGLLEQLHHDKTSSKPTVNTYTKIDYPVHGIRKFAEEGNYDLIICGTRGENVSTVDKFLGTVSDGLSQTPTCPTLYIPLNYPYEQINYIGYASNLSPSDPYELWRALELISPDVPITRFYHISDDDSDKIEKKKDDLEKYLYNHNDSLQIVFYDVDSNKVEDSLMELIHEFDLEVLVMMKRKQNFVERWFSKSLTKQMLHKANIPLLILNEE